MNIKLSIGEVRALLEALGYYKQDWIDYKSASSKRLYEKITKIENKVFKAMTDKQLRAFTKKG